MNPLRPVAIYLGARPWLPRYLSQIVWTDLMLQRLTLGRVSLLTLVGLPELTLRVPGRKSGIIRSTPLLYTEHPDGPLIAGSNWGASKPPMWVANLCAADTASVEIGGRRTTVRPRELSGEEREQKLGLMIDNWPNYAMYVERAAPRTIRVFQLEPVG